MSRNKGIAYTNTLRKTFFRFFSFLICIDKNFEFNFFKTFPKVDVDWSVVTRLERNLKDIEIKRMIKDSIKSRNES